MDTGHNIKYLQRAPSIFKPDVYCSDINGIPAVIKDYNHCPAWIRNTLCRWLIQREVRALQLLSDLTCVPDFLGYTTTHAFAISYVDGSHPDEKNCSATHDQYLQLWSAVAEMHRRGVAHNDLRNINVIINPDGNVRLIDFGAVVFRHDGYGAVTRLKNILFRILVQADRSHVVKMKSVMCSVPLTAEEQQVIAKNQWSRKVTRFWKTYINKGLIRKLRRKD